ncbi:MAG: glycosyltransferase family 4 protein [Deltaproteobacteria bacterium]|nr:glycosyltransferase family 4 protein [Deltaproteobacteria bacterium]
MTEPARSPCRVLVLNERDPKHPKAGGAETHVSEIFGRLARRGYAVTHLATGFAGGAMSERVDDIEVRRLGPLPLYYPRALWSTLRETRAGAYDVVVECLNKVPFYSPVYSRAPVLVLAHHLFGEVAFQQKPWPVAATVWASERLIPALYRRRPFVAISESTRSDLIARGLPAERIRVSHPGIDSPEVAPDLSMSDRAGVIFVGRLEVYKKVDVMLRAMARLSDRFPDAQITIVGRGPAEAALRKLAAELGLADRTHFKGFVSIAQRDRLLAEARVCVCPSEKEGWGLTVVESNAVGTPVVATDADGLRDSVRDGETGFLVADADVEGFARRIGELLADDILAATMSSAALLWSKKFDWEHTADDMAGAIEAARSTE